MSNLTNLKHTPGPWITEKSGSVIWIGPNFHRTDGKVELIVTHIDIDPEYKKGVLAKNEANAKLIAAAPELLQSCINLLSELSVEADSEPEGYSIIVQDALRAIKKATL